VAKMIVNVKIQRIALGSNRAPDIVALRAAVAAAVEHRVALSTSGKTLPIPTARVSEAVAAEVAARCS